MTDIFVTMHDKEGMAISKRMFTDVEFLQTFVDSKKCEAYFKIGRYFLVFPGGRKKERRVDNKEKFQTLIKKLKRETI